MNIGIYIDSLSDFKQLEEIDKLVSKSLLSDEIYDISLFFNELDFNPYNINCGIFNSTELWSFSGDLIVTSLNCLMTSNKIVNNIDIYYYFGLEEKTNIFQLIESSKISKAICKSEEHKKTFYRKTGKLPIGISQNLEGVLQIITEQKNGYKSNLNNVYKT